MGSNTSVPQPRVVPTSYQEYKDCKSAFVQNCACQVVRDYLLKGGEFPTDDYAILTCFPSYHHKGYTSIYLQGIPEEEKERYLKLLARFKQIAADVIYNLVIFKSPPNLKAQDIDPCVVYEGFKQLEPELKKIVTETYYDTVRLNHYIDLERIYKDEQRQLDREEEKYRKDQLAKEDPAEYAKLLFSGRVRRSPRHYGALRRSPSPYRSPRGKYY